MRAAVPRLGRPALGRSFAPPLPLIPFWLDPYSDAAGVGSKQEDTIAEVRGSDGCRGDTVPLRIPPARCQVPEDALERSSTVNGEETWDVFREDPRGVRFLRDAPDLGPEPALVGDAESLASDAGALAGETGNDKIHAVAIRSAIEGFQVVVDRTWIQGTFDHSTCEDRCREGLPLDSTHTTNSGESKAHAEFEPSVSGAEGEESVGTYSHIYARRILRRSNHTGLRWSSRTMVRLLRTR